MSDGSGARSEAPFNAVTELHQQGRVEDVRPSTRLWTVLVHQLFANVLETGGLTRQQLIDRVSFVPAFAGFTPDELHALLDHLVEHAWLDAIDGALVLGRRAEKRLGARNFFQLYAVFETGQTLTVRHDNPLIGTLVRWFVLMLSARRPLFHLAGRDVEHPDRDDRAALPVGQGRAHDAILAHGWHRAPRPLQARAHAPAGGA